MSMLKLAVFAIALAFLPAAASAADPDVTYIGKLENKSGGFIMLMLTDARPECHVMEHGYDVLSFNPEGRTIEGCWENMAELGIIKITWANGDVRVYPQADVILNPKLQQNTSQTSL